MAGNVLEWVGDWYRQNLCDFCSPESEAHQVLLRQLTGADGSPSDAEPRPPDAAHLEATSPGARQAPPLVNPAGPSTGSFKVLRGGSWQERDRADLATTRRFWLDPAQRFAHTGFRCAKDQGALKAGAGLLATNRTVRFCSK
jgi:formylglycine-generating enzyme required for sulfatase activity